MAYKRIKGGGRNLKSGMRWTKEEILEVAKLYIAIDGKGIHENNPEIQELADHLGRTVRSIESQVLMFRSIEKNGLYGHSNMNKLSKLVWSELNQIPEVPIEDPTYTYWNRKLIEHFFNERHANKEIALLPVTPDLFLNISNDKYSIKDYLLAIEHEIRHVGFLAKLKSSYELSLPRELNGRKVRKSIPQYFGFLCFVILGITEYEGDKLSSANVYKRINSYGSFNFGTNWSDINTTIARDLFEPIWRNLNDWSETFKNGRLGVFSLRNEYDNRRRYVSRLERHGLINNSHLQNLIIEIVKQGFSIKHNLSINHWISIFSSQRLRVSQKSLILEYLTESSGLAQIVADYLGKLLSSYLQSNTEILRSIQVDVDKRLLICIQKLSPFSNIIKSHHFRVPFVEIEDEVIRYKGHVYAITHDKKMISAPLINDNGDKLTFDLSKEVTIGNKFQYNNHIKWLKFEYSLNEYIEVSGNEISNFPVILWICSAELTALVSRNKIPFKLYKFENQELDILKFSNLSQEHYKVILSLYQPSKVDTGKLSIMSSFTLPGRKQLLCGFQHEIIYNGPLINPQLYIEYSDGLEDDKYILQPTTDNVYQVPTDLKLNKKWKIFASNSDVSSMEYSLVDPEFNEKALSLPSFKDNRGQSIESHSGDNLFDIPLNFCQGEDTANYNSWHFALRSSFIPSSSVVNLDIDKITYDPNSKGNMLLSYLSSRSCSTTNHFVNAFQILFPGTKRSLVNSILLNWQRLGYLHFDHFGGSLTIVPASLFHLQSANGIKVLWTGYRDHEFVKSVKSFCNDTNIDMSMHIASHSDNDERAPYYPQMIYLYDKRGNLSKIKRLYDEFDFGYINDISESLHSDYSVYQLACLHYQRDIMQFDVNIADLESYESDHHRKKLFNTTTYKWEETTVDLSTIENETLVRFDGFIDRSIIHVYKSEQGVHQIDNLGFGMFLALRGKTGILYKKECPTVDVYDFMVPFNIYLPYWIERSLFLVNGKEPSIDFIDGHIYKKYERINASILNVIEKKLAQKIETHD